MTIQNIVIMILSLSTGGFIGFWARRLMEGA